MQKKRKNQVFITTLSLLALLLITFSGCGGGSGKDSPGGNSPNGSFALSVAWPDGSKNSGGCKLIPEGSQLITISITGEYVISPITASVSYGSETTLTIENVPIGDKVALIKAFDASDNLKAQRKESFTINFGETTTSDHIPLGIAITGNPAVFEPSKINAPYNSMIYFQNWTDSAVTITTTGDPVELAAASGWSFPEKEKTAADFEIFGLGDAQCDLRVDDAAKITGTVTKDGLPVSGAKVKIGSVEYTTGADGKYTLSPVFTLGNVEITADKSTFIDYLGSVLLTDGEIIPKDITMAPQTKWQSVFTGNGSNNWLYQTIETSDNGTISAGYTDSTTGIGLGNHGGLHDALIIKCDSSGNKTWSKTIGGSSDDVASNIIQTSDGGYLFMGYTCSSDGNLYGYRSSSYYNGWIVKLTSSGEINWQKFIGSSDRDNLIYNFRKTSDGGYIASGYEYIHSGSTFVDGWLAKLDSSFNQTWSKTYIGTNDDRIWLAEEASDGGFMCIGYTNSTDGIMSGAGYHGGSGYDGWIMKTDSSGNKTSSKCIGGTGEDYTTSLVRTSDGSFLITGHSPSTDGDMTDLNIGGSDAWLIKVNINGSKAWIKVFGGTLNDGFNDIIKVSDGSGSETFLCSGYTNSTDGDSVGNNGSQDGFIIKIDSSGNKISGKCVGTASFESLNSMSETSDGGYIFSGYSKSIIKTDEEFNY